MSSMSEWGITLLAAASAVAGSLVTGWFTRNAGNRQADAARHAGDRQADALLDTVRATLEEERRTRLNDLRRQTYVGFLDAVETALLTRQTGRGHPEERVSLQRALAVVTLEGPAPVAQSARDLVTALGGSRNLDEVDDARARFLQAARSALGLSDPPP
jgi:hypothetical protein